MKRLALLFALVGIVVLGAGTVMAGRDRLSPELRAVATSLSRFHSVSQATAAGYSAASPCESSPAGTMGIHYVNGPLVGNPSVDPMHPEVLLYLPDSSGDLRLVGIEYMVVDADQNLATDNDRPSVFGHPFNGPMLGHTPGMPIHYDLHVWLYDSNPSGTFASWNPSINCP